MGAASKTMQRLSGTAKRLSGAFAKVAAGIRRSTGGVRVIKDCPKCQLPMWVVTGARWCSRCGYREMCDDTQVPGKAPAGQAEAEARGGAWKQALGVVPRWAWVMIGGLLAVVLGSLDANLLLPPGGWARAAWTTAQVVTGLAGLVLAQVSVCSLLGAHKEGLSLWDLVVPERVWRVAIKRLPLTQGQVCAAAWSLALVLCGLVLIGGLTYWLPRKGDVKPQVYVAKLLDIKKEQLQEEEAAKPQATPPPQPQQITPPPTQPTAGGGPAVKPETSRCVVVGYTVEGDDVTGLVVARVEGDELRYAGTIKPNLTPQEKDNLLKRFATLAAKQPIFQNFNKPVVWLKPTLNCEVEHSGTGEDSLLKEARFKGLVEDDKPAPDGAATGGQPAGKSGAAPKAPATPRPAPPMSGQAAADQP